MFNPLFLFAFVNCNQYILMCYRFLVAPRFCGPTNFLNLDELFIHLVSYFPQLKMEVKTDVLPILQYYTGRETTITQDNTFRSWNHNKVIENTLLVSSINYMILLLLYVKNGQITTILHVQATIFE